MSEKLCLICQTPLVQRPREPNMRFALRDSCGRSHAAMIRRRQFLGTMPKIEEAPKPKSPWDDVVFPTIDPGDGGLIKMPRPETHVQYVSSAAWAYRGE